MARQSPASSSDKTGHRTPDKRLPSKYHYVYRNERGQETEDIVKGNIVQLKSDPHKYAIQSGKSGNIQDPSLEIVSIIRDGSPKNVKASQLSPICLKNYTDCRCVDHMVYVHPELFDLQSGSSQTYNRLSSSSSSSKPRVVPSSPSSLSHLQKTNHTFQQEIQPKQQKSSISPIPQLKSTHISEPQRETRHQSKERISSVGLDEDRFYHHHYLSRHYEREDDDDDDDDNEHHADDDDDEVEEKFGRDKGGEEDDPDLQNVINMVRSLSLDFREKARSYIEFLKFNQDKGRRERKL